MLKQFDTVVVGTGVAGSSIARSLQAAGQKVAAIENAFWGGTCPNRGCDPKKILLGAVEAKTLADQLKQTGLKGNTQIEWPALMEKKRAYTVPFSPNAEKWLKKGGVETYHAQGQFNDAGNFEVDGDELQADHFVIATGLRPSILPIEGKNYLETSNEFLDMDEMPRKIALIGAGFEAFEFAAIANAAGAEVHVIHHNDRPLKKYDAQMAQAMVDELSAKGVQFDFNVDIQKVEKQNANYVLSDQDGYKLTVNRVFGMTGRIPNVSDLGLEKVNVTFDKHGVQVDNHLQTTNSKVYAVGDVVARPSFPKLTPIATFDANYVVNEIVGHSQGAIQYPVIPVVVFGAPKLAQVGIDTVTADKDDRYEVKTLDVTGWFSYMRINEPKAVVKVVLDKEKHQIVGAQVLSGEADQLINYFTFIVEDHLTMDQIKHHIFAYPTIASDLDYFG